jgi:hypothetical protein
MGPLSWSDPVGGTWERPGFDVAYDYSESSESDAGSSDEERLDVVYDYGESPNLEITLEEARGCYLWMVTILSVLGEAWDRVAALGDLADAPSLDWSQCEDGSSLERARVALPACDAVLSALREREEPILHGAAQWFDELKPVIAVAAIVPSELRRVQTRYDAGLLLTGQFRDAIEADALVKSGLSDEIDEVLRDMEWALIEVRPWIERLPEPGSPSAIVHLSALWEVPSTPRWLAWQAVYGDDTLPLDP